MANQSLAKLDMVIIGQVDFAQSVDQCENAWSDERDVGNVVLKIDVETVDWQKDLDELGDFLLRLRTWVGRCKNAFFVRLQIRHEHDETRRPSCVVLTLNFALVSAMSSLHEY